MSKNNLIAKLDKMGFESSLTFFLYENSVLFEAIKKRSWTNTLPHVIAELFIRYCFAKTSELKDILSKIIPETLFQELNSIADYPLKLTPFHDSLTYSIEKEVIDSIIQRYNLIKDIDGSFPICTEDNSFLVTFKLYPKKDKTLASVVDLKDNIIEQWSKAVDELNLDYQVKLQFVWDGLIKLTGNSLQLPVYLAILAKEKKIIPFDPFRFITTGAIKDDKVVPVQFFTKYIILQDKYPQAFFCCPTPFENSEIKISNNIAIIPLDLKLKEVRNFCFEYIIANHLTIYDSKYINFVGRKDELAQIHQLLNPTCGKTKKVPFLLGCSGIGKTQIAIQYGNICHIYEYKNESVILNASNNIDSFASIFSSFWHNPFYQAKFNFSMPEYFTDDEKLKYIINILESKGDRILFILDNLDHKIQLNAEINKFFNNYEKSCIDIIATSTACSFRVNPNDCVCFIPINGLDVRDGVELLNSKREIISNEERLAAEGIVNFLGGNAWALDVISEILKNNDEQFDDDYQEQFKKLKEFPVDELSPSSNMVQISHGKNINPEFLFAPVLKRLMPDELDIAIVAACCDSENIYPYWLQKFYEEKHAIKFTSTKEWLRKGIISHLRQNHILIEAGQLFSMHNLTKIVLLNLYKDKVKENNLLLLSILQGYKKEDLGFIENFAICKYILNSETPIFIHEELKLAVPSKFNNLMLATYRHELHDYVIKLSEHLLQKIEMVDWEDDTEKNEYKARLLHPVLSLEILKCNFGEAKKIIEEIKKLILHSKRYYAYTLCRESEILRRTKQIEKCEKLLAEAYSILTENNFTNDWIFAIYLLEQAYVNATNNRINEAIENMFLCLELKKEHKMSSINIAKSLLPLGEFYNKAKEYEKAIKCLNEAEEIFHLNNIKSDNLSFAHIYTLRSTSFFMLNFLDKALIDREQSMIIHEQKLSKTHRFLKYDYEQLINLYDALNDTQKADIYRQKISLLYLQ